MCSYAVSRVKPLFFRPFLVPLFIPPHRRAQRMALAFSLTLLLTHELNLLTPNPFSAANPMMGGRVLS